MSRVLIFGTTGRVGGATLAALDALPDDQCPKIRVFVRRPQAVPTTRHTIETSVGTLDDAGPLRRAFDGIDTAFLVTGDDRNQVAMERAVIIAAAASGRPRIVKLSAITAGLTPPASFGKFHGAVEDDLRGSGLPFTILRPTMFFQSLELFADPVKKAGRLIAPSETGAVSFVDLRDVAAIAAKTLVEPGHEGKTYTLTGAAALTMADVAVALSIALDRTVRHVSPPLMVGRVMMRLAGGMDWWLAGQVTDLFAAIRRDAESEVSDDVARLTGRAPISLKAYLADRADFWSAHTSDSNKG